MELKINLKGRRMMQISSNLGMIRVFEENYKVSMSLVAVTQRRFEEGKSGG